MCSHADLDGDRQKHLLFKRSLRSSHILLLVMMTLSCLSAPGDADCSVVANGYMFSQSVGEINNLIMLLSSPRYCCFHCMYPVLRQTVATAVRVGVP